MKNVRTPLFALMMTATLTGAVVSACSGGGSSSSSSSSGSSGTSSSSSSSSSSTGGTSSSSGGTVSSSHTTASSHSASSGGFMFPDAGPIDAGFVPYTGTPEDGVKCGGSVCSTDGGFCCINVTNGSSMCGASCSIFAGLLGLACDGPEDCPAAKVCCFTGITMGGACTDQSACVPTSNFGPFQLCNTSAECVAGSGCCSSETLNGYLMGTDFGTCQVGCGL